MNSGPRVLVTGASGWTGGHLVDLAGSFTGQVLGLWRRGPGPSGTPGVAVDITDRQRLSDLLRDWRPDWIFHLAGRVPQRGTATSDDFRRINVTGTRVLFESIESSGLEPRILVAGSSVIYGEGGVDGPGITEDAALVPSDASPYAQSKLDQDRLAQEWSRPGGLDIVRARTFNQVGPGEPPAFVCASLARQVSALRHGGLSPVRIRDATAARDFTDVRDVVRAYWMLLDSGECGEVYNVCSGRATTLMELVSLLGEIAGLGDIQVMVEDRKPADDAIVRQVGDYRKLLRCCGWKPRIDLARSLEDLVSMMPVRRSATR